MSELSAEGLIVARVIENVEIRVFLRDGQDGTATVDYDVYPDGFAEFAKKRTHQFTLPEAWVSKIRQAAKDAIRSVENEKEANA